MAHQSLLKVWEYRHPLALQLSHSFPCRSRLAFWGKGHQFPMPKLAYLPHTLGTGALIRALATPALIFIAVVRLPLVWLHLSRAPQRPMGLPMTSSA